MSTLPDDPAPRSLLDYVTKRSFLTKEKKTAMLQDKVHINNRHRTYDAAMIKEKAWKKKQKELEDAEEADE